MEQASKTFTYRVRVGIMRESHRTSYWVIIDRSDRKPDAKPWDTEGRVTPFCTKVLEHARFEAEEWAEFLGTVVDEDAEIPPNGNQISEPSDVHLIRIARSFGVEDSALTGKLFQMMRQLLKGKQLPPIPWICANCSCSFFEMPSECPHGHQKCTDLLNRGL